MELNWCPVADWAIPLFEIISDSVILTYFRIKIKNLKLISNQTKIGLFWCLVLGLYCLWVRLSWAFHSILGFYIIPIRCIHLLAIFWSGDFIFNVNLVIRGLLLILVCRPNLLSIYGWVELAKLFQKKNWRRDFSSLVILRTSSSLKMATLPLLNIQDLKMRPKLWKT